MSPSETTQPREGSASPRSGGGATPASRPAARTAQGPTRAPGVGGSGQGAAPRTETTKVSGAGSGAGGSSGAGRGSTPRGTGAGRGTSAAEKVRTSVDAERPAPYQDPPAARPAAAPESGPPRRVRLTASRVNPWSVCKLSLLLSFAAGIVIVVVVFILWSVLNGMGVFSRLDGVISDVVGSESSINVLSILSLSHVLAVTVLLAVLDVLIITIIATLASVLYNISSALVGGLRLTLTDD